VAANLALADGRLKRKALRRERLDSTRGRHWRTNRHRNWFRNHLSGFLSNWFRNLLRLERGFRSRRRERANETRDIRSREALCQEQLDFGFRLVRGGLDELLGVFWLETWGEKDGAGEMQTTIADGIQECRETSGRASHANSLERHVLGEAQLLDAVRELEEQPSSAYKRLASNSAR
jgi:hypothetical protein